MNRQTIRLVALVAMLFVATPLLRAQHRLSVDVTTVQVSEGKKVTTQRSLYLNPDGRLVAEQHKPMHLISLTNALGEMRIYDPKNNEVAVINDKELASSKEIVSIFSSGAYTDMALPLYGFDQSDTRREDGLIIKTFVPKAIGTVAKVELVFSDRLPICMIYYNGAGESLRKVYFSRYEYGRIPMPMRVTEIEYTSQRDSLVRLSTYSNLLFGAEASSEMFDYVIPKDAGRTTIDPNMLMGR